MTLPIKNKQDIHMLTGDITTEFESGSLSLTDIGERLKQLNAAQLWLLEQLEQTSISSEINGVRSLAWTEILTTLEVPAELAKDLEQISKSFGARQALAGYSPVEAWGQCYSYFEHLRSHLEGLSTIAQCIEDDPSYLSKALETLKLRSVSKEVHQSF